MTYECIDSLIDAIYAAAADPRLWPHVLRLLVENTSGCGAAIHINSTDTVASTFGANYAIDPSTLTSYEDYYHGINPWALPLSLVPAGTVVRDLELTPRDQVVSSEFYNDYLRAAGLGGSLTSVLARSQWTLACLGIVHPLSVETLDARDVALLRRLTPHLQRAVDLNRRLASIHAERNAMTQTLDRLKQGVLLLDEEQRAVYVNPAAEAILRKGDGLTLRGGRLSATEPGADAELARAIGGATSGAGERGGVVCAPRSSASRPLAARVTPLPVEQNFWGSPPGARAIVFIVDPEAAPSINQEMVKSMFGLTNSEARLALALARGDDLRDVAERHDLRLATVRTQLKFAMAKTDTHRQAELAALIARLNILPDKE